MALVWIVYVPTADLLAPDETRMNRIEEMPDDQARMMVNDGSGRWPTDEEVAAWQEQRQVEAKASEAAAAGDLTKMLKADLLAHAAEQGVEGVDESMTKADIAQAIEDHTAAASSAEAQG